jgi:type II restriction enzyme
MQCATLIIGNEIIMNINPGLFGLEKTNRDFTQRETWGKNQFNSSFPAALCCYLYSKNIEANYLCVSNGDFEPDFLSIEKVFGIKPSNKKAYFAFEAQHSPYQKYVVGALPRTDLVIQREDTGECLAGLEVKLTALPDNTTCELSNNLYGSEIVVRPDTIVYLACSIAAGLGSKLGEMVPDITVADWSEPKHALEKIDEIVSAIEAIAISMEERQSSFLI